MDVTRMIDGSSEGRRIYKNSTEFSDKFIDGLKD